MKNDAFLALKVRGPAVGPRRAERDGRLGRRRLARAGDVGPHGHPLHRPPARCAASSSPRTGPGTRSARTGSTPPTTTGSRSSRRRADERRRPPPEPGRRAAAPRAVAPCGADAPAAADPRGRRPREAGRAVAPHGGAGPQHGPAAPEHARRAPRRAQDRRRGRDGAPAARRATSTAASRRSASRCRTTSGSRTSTAWTTWRRSTTSTASASRSSGWPASTVPERAEYIRIILAEVQRIVSHVIAVGTYGLDLGAITPFLHTFREREKGLDLLDHVSGGRLLYHMIRIGGVKRDLSPEWLDECNAFLDAVERRMPEYNQLLLDNHIFRERTAGIGVIPRETAIAFGRHGARAARVGRRLRLPPRRVVRHLRPLRLRRPGRAERHHGRRRRLLPPPLGARSRRWRSPCGSCARRCASCRGARSRRKLPKSLKPPKGEVYVRVENPRGELAYYLVSEGGRQAVAGALPRAVLQQHRGPHRRSRPAS